ncbi:hypothetical protein F4677DRAFT_449947 [Hypoxylon crocopeplum]|nr:hypothetical protein F4677DRAFT_449947 [Hypoxylon crocopeplum]
MDIPIMPAPEGSVHVQKFLDVPYNKRWEPLKPVIISIYIEERHKLASLAERMKKEYSFDAQIHQYRYYFKKWGIKKRITTEEKGAVITALGKRRLQAGVSTSSVILNQGGSKKDVDKKQLKRYINQSIRESEPLILNPGLFLRHALPYAALVRGLGGHAQDHISPSGTTPTYITIDDPQVGGPPSTAHNGISPTMQLVQRKVLLHRAALFIQGREQELVKHMSGEERRLTTTWLHDFWIYSFMTAKYWGRGPKIWTKSLIDFKSFSGHPCPSTPDRPIDQEGPSGSPSSMAINSPTQLCRWAIHYKAPSYERIISPPPSPVHEERFDVDDESTWTEWPRLGSSEDLATIISSGLQQNLFTAVQSEELPLAMDSIVKTVERSQDETEAEAMGFAIMARNVEALADVLGDGDLPDCFSKVFPFHLAAQFLGGAKSCCSVMDMLVKYLSDSNSIGVNYIDNSGHTVLDMFFVTILRSHSTVPLHILSDAFAGQSRYSGQEVDPCGRWDADSPCIRQLYAAGRSTIPPEWKHIFCHTSVQAICHCISAIFYGPWAPNINTPSGLFMRRCSNCGLELKVGPLHALVLAAFFLANDGMPGENLFGMVSCLLCLLTWRADPTATADVSISALLGYGVTDETDECQHSSMNAAELASKVASDKVNSWTLDIKLGWEALIAVLKHDIVSRHDRTARPGVEGEGLNTCKLDIHEIERDEELKIVYCGNEQLGLVWAAIQVELLTYRRVSQEDPWLSPRFHMETLRKGLEKNDVECMNQLAGKTEDATEGRLQAHSRCGLFYKASHRGCAVREEACTSYYGNLDDWKRSTFIKPVAYIW